MATLSAFLEQTAALHKHLCPRQVLGVRIGMLAADLFGLELPQSNKRLHVFVEADGCFADGVSVATGCWLGHRTMRLMDYGKVAATFIDTDTNQATRIWPNPMSRQLAAEYCPDIRDRWHKQLAAYQVMPIEDLLCFSEVTLTVSMSALISRPGIRATCDECSEEILNERQVEIAGRVLCRSCANGGYYELLMGSKSAPQIVLRQPTSSAIKA